MNEERLLCMKTFLEDVVAKAPEDKFDQSYWTDEKFDVNDCHTSACAMGWAAHAKLFPGLELATRSGEDLVLEYKTVMYEFKYAFDAVGLLFEIPPRHAEYLFGESDYTAEIVAERIQDYVDNMKRDGGNPAWLDEDWG